MRAWLPWAGLASATLLVSTGACGRPTANGFAPQTDDGGSDSSSNGGSSGASDDSPIFGGDASIVPTCVTHCSSDLHSVIDCNNQVVTMCPPDKGCGPGGTCVAACQSADANKSTIGCDYYSVDPGTDGEANGSCFAAYIANTWGSPVSIKIDYAGQSVDAAPYAFVPSGQGASLTYTPLPGGQVPTGQLAIVFLADATAVTNPVLPTRCPAGTKAFYTAAEASSEYTGVLHAFHVTTSAPVVAYDIFPYGGSLSYISSATLLIPTSAWDTNYLAIDTWPMSQVAGPTAQPFTEIVASQDATHVTISPTAAIVGGNGVAATAQGKPVMYTLNHGDVVQLKQDTELNGSPIQSDKPIGVWGGNSCQNIDVTDTACDSGHQQLPPVKALGHEYVAARYRDRQANNEEDAPWRIMGAVDGTTFTYEPGTPNGAPTVLDSGQVGMFYAAGPFVVRSQDAKHPFYVSGHMGGQNFNGGDYGTGDPESVNIIPPEQYLASYVFMTDPTMANTNLVLVRGKAQDGTFKDVMLDCAGVVSGWLPAGSVGDYEIARADLVIGGAPSGNCNNGRHEIHSDAAFGLTVWGWDTYVSYAYPSGASVQPINTVVVPPNPK